MTPYSGYHHTVEYIIITDYGKPYIWSLLKRGIELFKSQSKVKFINKTFDIDYDTVAFMHAYLIISDIGKEKDLLYNLDDESVGFLISNYFLYLEKTGEGFTASRRQGDRLLQKDIYTEIIGQRQGIIEFLSPEARNWLGLADIKQNLLQRQVLQGSTHPILIQHEEDIKRLRRIKNAKPLDQALAVLSDNTREVLFNTNNAEWGENVYHELYAFFSPLDPSPCGKQFLIDHKELFNLSLPDEKDQIRNFIKGIVQAAALRELKKEGLSEEENRILKKYIFPVNSGPEAMNEHMAQFIELLESKQFQSDKQTFYRYCSILYKMHCEALKWINERLGPASLEDSDEDFFGQGDEHEFQAGLTSMYIEEYNKVGIPVWTKLGYARYYMLRGNIHEALLAFKRALLNDPDLYDGGAIEKAYSETSIDSLNREAISLVSAELSGMQEQQLEGVEEAARALGIDLEKSRGPESLAGSKTLSTML